MKFIPFIYILWSFLSKFPIVKVVLNIYQGCYVYHSAYISQNNYNINKTCTNTKGKNIRTGNNIQKENKNTSICISNYCTSSMYSRLE
jgi:hypothetical protein